MQKAIGEKDNEKPTKEIITTFILQATNTNQLNLNLFLWMRFLQVYDKLSSFYTTKNVQACCEIVKIDTHNIKP